MSNGIRSLTFKITILRNRKHNMKFSDGMVLLVPNRVKGRRFTQSIDMKFQNIRNKEVSIKVPRKRKNIILLYFKNQKST